MLTGGLAAGAGSSEAARPKQAGVGRLSSLSEERRRSLGRLRLLAKQAAAWLRRSEPTERWFCCAKSRGGAGVGTEQPGTDILLCTK